MGHPKWSESPEFRLAVVYKLTHQAVRLVQELGINQRARIEALVQVKLAGKDGNRERHIRNYERARYIASFLDGVCAMTIGGPNDRSDPNSALVTIDDEWWMSPLATLGDRVTAGHLELHKTMVSHIATLFSDFADTDSLRAWRSIAQYQETIRSSLP